MGQRDARMTTAWERLGQLVREARFRRGWLRQEDLAAAAGVSVAAVSKIERGLGGSGRRPTAVALKVAAALGWSQSSIDRVLAGDDPVPLPGSPVEPPTPEAVRETLDDVIRDIEASPALSKREKRQLIAQVEIIKQDREGWE
jgi:transcriptional regulator with XRE-family HTH domain